jgi:dTDP-4-amino-4,6-dideoxygalactose transaminase
MSNYIGFNKPYMTGKETAYIEDAVREKKISGDGIFTKKCHEFFESRYKFPKTLLTTSCTDALEMAALLLNITEGDEVIMPAFTFVSTANAFALRGARIRFADSTANNPNIDAELIEELITSRTRAIVPVHYAGVACDMDRIAQIASKHNIRIVEDAAQAIDSYYKDRPLGSLGALSAFSFHETKNIISGEGGMLAINDRSFIARAEIIREKGTNRSQFFRGEVDKYGWVDIGSSFLPSDIIAAFLYAQLEHITEIQRKRLELWSRYRSNLSELSSERNVMLPSIPDYATNNAHMFYLVCNSLAERTELIAFLKSRNIQAVFHYLSLHKSPYYSSLHDGRGLPQCDRFADCLVRLPLYYELTVEEVDRVSDVIRKFYNL